MITTRRQMQQTVVRFHVELETDNEAALQDLIAVALSLLMLIWQFWQAASRAVTEVRLFCQDVAVAVKYVKRTWAARLSLSIYEMIGIRLWETGELYQRFSAWS